MKRLTVLLAEDEALIAYDIEDRLSGAGFEVLGPYTTVADAEERVRCETPDVAVVDVRLRDGSALHMIENLTRRGIPVVIVSGLEAPDDYEHQNAPWLTKPVQFADLLCAIHQVMANEAPTTAQS